MPLPAARGAAGRLPCSFPARRAPWV